MVRSRRILETIEAEGLIDRAVDIGRHLLDRLRDLAAEFPALVVDPRGRGLMCAFGMPTAAQRDELITELWDRRVIMLASGPDSVRFRPALTASRSEIDAAVDAVRAVLAGM
jgi:L-lysine 6-transaminase